MPRTADRLPGHSWAVIMNLWAFALDRSIPRRGAVLRAYFIIWLKRKLRRTGAGTIRVLDCRVQYGDLLLFRMLFREIFMKRTYAFDCDTSTPRIIDAGANIGLATIFFKSIYPNAKIVAFEPDPRTFALLKQNVCENALESVTLVNAALGDEEGTVEFFVRNDVVAGDIGASTQKRLRYEFHGPSEIKKIAVPSVRLSQHLHRNRPVDLLKLDIEGSEGSVFRDIAPYLAGIGAIAMEYHHIPDANPLEPIVAALSASGHRYKTSGPENDGTIFIRTQRA